MTNRLSAEQEDRGFEDAPISTAAARPGDQSRGSCLGRRLIIRFMFPRPTDPVVGSPSAERTAAFSLGTERVESQQLHRCDRWVWPGPNVRSFS